MFPIKWSDFFRKKDGNLVFMDELSGGGSVNFMTQSEWNALTFNEKKAEGFTAIGVEGTPVGTYYDYTNVSEWNYNSEHDNVVDVLLNFHGFFSNTIGDNVRASGRGGVRASNDRVFICNAKFSNNYGYVIMFGSSQAALQCTDTNYYNILKVNGYDDLYAGGNWEGAWSGNTDVQLTHNSVTQYLQNYFDPDDYTLKNVATSSTGITIPETYTPFIQAIKDFITST